ncbi:S-locus lectin protein kinase family protein [Artemisia annua]|uniref:S-locus lectin protein kinase family protein n=1 Tax=Artemisia annua TaxID=35608 RepID=A0A2U1LUB1_ARTAN|nr:S-locus lectin protein kinase family protein [Artemisia annua]
MVYHREDPDRKAKAKRRVIIIVIPVVVGAALILGLCLCYRRRKYKKNGIISVGRENGYANENKGEDWELPLFDFNIIASATNNFSDNCKLGEGGYGPVYKNWRFKDAVMLMLLKPSNMICLRPANESNELDVHKRFGETPADSGDG